MPWRIEYRPEVMEDVQGISANLRERIQRAVGRRLGTSPGLYGERLVKDLAGLWKLRVGGYRVVFSLDEAARIVTIWCIRVRRDIYPEARRRWRRR